MRIPRLKWSTKSRAEELERLEEDIIQKARRLLRLEAEAGVQQQPFFLRERRRNPR